MPKVFRKNCPQRGRRTTTSFYPRLGRDKIKSCPRRFFFPTLARKSIAKSSSKVYHVSLFLTKRGKIRLLHSNTHFDCTLLPLRSCMSSLEAPLRKMLSKKIFCFLFFFHSTHIFMASIVKSFFCHSHTHTHTHSPTQNRLALRHGLATKKKYALRTSQKSHVFLPFFEPLQYIYIAQIPFLRIVAYHIRRFGN